MTHSLHVRMQVEHKLRWQSVCEFIYCVGLDWKIGKLEKLENWKIGVFPGLIQSPWPYV